MKSISLLVGALLSLTLHSPVLAEASDREQPTESCDPIGDLHFICGVSNAEDLAHIPGTDWILASSLTKSGSPAGQILAINTSRRDSIALTLKLPEEPIPEYADCPAVPDIEKFHPHGIALTSDKQGHSLLYVINHAEREAVEIFSVDASGDAPDLQWLGCVVLPEGTYANSLALLADGGFVFTKFYQVGDKPFGQQALDGDKTGLVYRWSPQSGFSEIPNSSGQMNNGIVVSDDEKWLFVALWTQNAILRMPLDGSSDPVTIPLDFMPDNIHHGPDGKLLAGGQISTIKILFSCKTGHCPADWAVAEIDQQTLAVDYILWKKGDAAFGNATGAIHANGALWLSSYLSDRVAIKPDQ